MIVVLTAGRLVAEGYRALISLSRALSASSSQAAGVLWVIKSCVAHALEDGSRGSGFLIKVLTLELVVGRLTGNLLLETTACLFLAHSSHSVCPAGWAGHCAVQVCGDDGSVCKVSPQLGCCGAWNTFMILEERGSKKTQVWFVQKPCRAGPRQQSSAVATVLLGEAAPQQQRSSISALCVCAALSL